MNAGGKLRQFHRWLGMTFTVASIVNIAAVIRGSNAQWLGILAVIPLIPLMITGVYMFLKPYFGKTRRFEESEAA